ncbi:MAG: SDR family NAD(P)-dependent oxidoreductase [Flavobacteriales bacterium]|jgi:short-subunit dehydrogenase|nr:SDR family NAD(P)-dependent oxidoreductase [Flavobacteriales bacterium]MBK9288407.1 SDR family NAD(P)-dependent oxidoreductase [Flavobacteriales bacterium]
MSKERGYALVTGASQGLGRAIAMELARQGFGLVVTARTAAALDDLCREAGALNGGRAHAVAVDLLAPDAVERIASTVEAKGLPLDAIVNNAGQGLWGLFQDLTLEEQHRMMRLNMDLPVMLTHRLLPLLRRRPDTYILNIASMVAYHALASMAVYSGSKAFVLRWSRSLRMELKGTGVKVTCVCPGSVITGFTERAGMQAMDDLAQKFGTGPEPVAKEAVQAMLRGKAEVVPGLLNRITAGLQGLMPGALIESVASGIYLKRLPRKG